MTAALRPTVVLFSLSMLSLACQPGAARPAASQDVPPPTSSATATPPAKTDAPEPTPEPPTPTISQTWRFTSLVTGGAEGFENLLGANGFYELEIETDGTAATLRKVGQKGTPRLPDAEILTGSGTLVSASNAQWPTATRRTLDVELSGNGSKRRLVFDLWFVADELHGTWAAPNDKHENKVGDSWGLVQGRQGAGEPLVLDNGANTPCMVCARAFFNCDTGFFDEPGCNAADASRSECDQKLERARAAGSELPRGCGDYFL
jgi:hypothetical protein